MTATLVFLAVCALILSSPFVWRWRKKRQQARKEFEASRLLMQTDMRRMGLDIQFDERKR